MYVLYGIITTERDVRENVGKPNKKKLNTILNKWFGFHEQVGRNLKLEETGQSVITCSKLIETLESGVKYVLS